MRLAGFVIGVLVIVGSLIAFFAPLVLFSWARALTTPGGLYVIAALRIAVGLVLVLAARTSRAPSTLRLLGVLVILAGLMTPWFGVVRTRALLDWWAGAGRLTMRLAAGVAMAIGGFLVYAFRSAPPVKNS